MPTPAPGHCFSRETSRIPGQRIDLPRNRYSVARRRIHRTHRQEVTRLSNFAALTRMRIQLTIRNKMFLFFSVIMPFGFFFLYAGVFAKGVPEGVRYLLGPVVSLAVMGSFWGLSAALVTFREQGILRRFHVTPVTAADMLASSIVANYVLTLPTIILELLFARVLFHVTDFGNLISFFLLVTVGVVAFAAMGLIVASVTNTMQETQVLNQLIWLPLIFLSGATMPL